MKALLITILIIQTLGVLIDAIHLCEGKYPRVKSTNPWQDVVGLIIGCAMCVWIALVLFLGS